MNYIRGFIDKANIPKYNFKQEDALPYEKEGNLQELIYKLYRASRVQLKIV